MTKKSYEILAVKMEIFLRKKRHSEILVREKLFPPPNSAPGLRHWFCYDRRPSTRTLGTAAWLLQSRLAFSMAA